MTDRPSYTTAEEMSRLLCAIIRQARCVVLLDNGKSSLTGGEGCSSIRVGHLALDRPLKKHQAFHCTDWAQEDVGSLRSISFNR